MQFLQTFAGLFANFGNLTWQMVVMWVIGGLLIYLAIAKKMEPSLLLPMGFGAILVNLPLSGAITQGTTVGPISALFDAGMSNELFPLLLFIGIGAMIDFGPLLEKPWLMLFGAAAQFGIFFTLFLAGFFFDMKDAASIAVIGAADGPTAIFVANTLKSQYLGAIMVAAYSYMALVPIVQPPVIRLLTTQKERRIRMPYEKGNVTQLTKILFPVVVTVVAGLVAPASVALVGFLMFGNLLRECGVLNSLSETAQNVLANLITLLLGLTVAGQMTADKFVRPDTLLILALGLVAFVFDTIGGVLVAVFFCMAIICIVMLLAIHFGWPVWSASAVVCAVATVLCIWLAVAAGRRSLRDALMFLLDGKDRLFVLDVRLLAGLARNITGFVRAAVEIQRELERLKNTLPEMEAVMGGMSLGGQLKRLEEDYNLVKKKRPILSKEGSQTVRYEVSDMFLRFWFRYFIKYQNYIEIQNFERLADIIKKDYPTFSGLALEMYFRQQMMESKEFADIGSWWQGKNNKDQDEIDIVGLYAEEKKALVAEVKRQSKNFKPDLFALKVEELRKKALFKYDIESRLFSMEDM